MKEACVVLEDVLIIFRCSHFQTGVDVTFVMASRRKRRSRRAA